MSKHALFTVTGVGSFSTVAIVVCMLFKVGAVMTLSVVGIMSVAEDVDGTLIGVVSVADVDGVLIGVVSVADIDVTLIAVVFPLERNNTGHLAFPEKSMKPPT